MGKGVNLDITLEEHIRRQRSKTSGGGKRGGRNSSQRRRGRGGNYKNQRNRSRIGGRNNNTNTHNNRGNNNNNRGNNNTNRGNNNRRGSNRRSRSRRPIVQRRIRKGGRISNNNNPRFRPTGRLRRTRGRGNQGNQGNRNNNNNGGGQRRIIRRAPRGQRNLAAEKNLKRLIVSNLPLDVNNNDIYELFSQFGPMNVCKIKYDKLGKSYGVAVVEYRDENFAKRAMKEYNGALLDKEVISITYAKRRNGRRPSGSNNVVTTRPRIISRVQKRGGRRGGQRSIRSQKRANNRRITNRNRRQNNR